jgi:hypothetical protein
MNRPRAYDQAELSDLEPATEGTLLLWPRTTPFIRIHGVTGSGKTHACWALQRRVSAKYVDLPYYQDRGKPWYEAVDCVFNPYHLPEVRTPLILDDLSACPDDDGKRWSKHVWTIIDQRLKLQLPTLVTMAVTLDELGERYQSASLISRLRTFTEVALPNFDHRGGRG